MMNKQSSTNIHKLIDKLGASLGGFVYRKSLIFSKSLESVSIKEAASDTTVTIGGLKEGTWGEITSEGSAGTFSGGFLNYRWLSNKVPTLLYMHGSGEQPYNFGRFTDNTFKKIFTKGFKSEVNLILIAAPFHEHSQNEYIKALGYLNNYVGLLATAAASFDALADRLKKEGSPEVYAAGFSLGAWALNVHRAFRGNNIDRYIPICAGAKPSGVFISSEYRKLTALQARNKPELLSSKLDFETEFKASNNGKCYPLMFRYDLLTELEAQRGAYDGMEIAILDKGHFTGLQAINDFRQHIISSIN